MTLGPPISVVIWGRHGVADSDYGRAMGGCTEPWVQGYHRGGQCLSLGVTMGLTPILPCP